MRSLAFAAAAALILTTAQSAGSVTTEGAAPTAVEADAASTTGAPTSPANPFSDPVWYPLREEAKVGCGRSNPGCDRPHNFWTQILTPLGQKDNATTSKALVTAMGAGIARIGEANGDKCGSGDASYGTWVWVDHGGGVISRYGHLSEILISDGDQVAAGDPVGIIGTSGKRSSDSCFRAYLNFQVKEFGVRGNDVEFPTLKACDEGKVETWPRGFTDVDTWNEVSATEIAPANSDDCFPPAVPVTTGPPTDVTLTQAGTGKLKVSWTKPPAGVDIIRMELARFRSNKSTNKWEAQHESTWRDRATATASTFSGLRSGSKYRVRVHFHTAGVGWSKASSFVSATAK